MRGLRMAQCWLSAGVPAVLMAVAGCDASPEPPELESVLATTLLGAADDADGTTVEMTQALTFEPAEITIQPGDTVTWTNPSGVVHTVTADPDLANNPDEHVRLPEGAETFHSGDIAAGDAWSYTFTVPGRYTYFCVPHERAGMIGHVDVRPRPEDEQQRERDEPDGMAEDASPEEDVDADQDAAQPRPDEADGTTSDERDPEADPHAVPHPDHDDSTTDEEDPLPPGTIAAPSTDRPAFMNWLGRFHPPMINFPIGLLLGALAAELLLIATKRTVFRPAVRFCVWAGAVGAVIAGFFGWMLAGFRLLDPWWILSVHRWLGTATVLWSILLVIALERSERVESSASGTTGDRSSSARLAFRLVLFIGAGLITATGFFGGAMLYGLDHYAWPT